MHDYVITDETSYCFGDSDRKIVIFSNKEGFEYLYNEIKKKMVKGIPIVLKSNKEPSNKLIIKLSNKTNIEINENNIILYISNFYLKDFINQIYQFIQYGSFTIVEANTSFNKDNIMEVVFSYYPTQQSSNE